MAVQPKQFVASATFQYRGVSYVPGDPITDRRTIAHLVRYGDRFAKRAPKSAPAETPADPALVPATTPPAESNKED